MSPALLIGAVVLGSYVLTRAEAPTLTRRQQRRADAGSGTVPSRTMRDSYDVPDDYEDDYDDYDYPSEREEEIQADIDDLSLELDTLRAGLRVAREERREAQEAVREARSDWREDHPGAAVLPNRLVPAAGTRRERHTQRADVVSANHGIRRTLHQQNKRRAALEVVRREDARDGIAESGVIVMGSLFDR